MKNIGDFLGLRRNILVMLAGVFALGLGEELWTRFIPKYLESLGAGIAVVGVFGTIRDLLDALYQYPGGWLADRLGHRRSLMVFALLASAGYALLLFSQGWVAILPGMVLIMAWGSSAQPAIFAVIGDNLPSARRSIGFGVQSILKRIPIVIAPVLGGWCIVHFGLRTGMKVGFAISIVLAGLAVVVIHLYYRDTSAGTPLRVSPLQIWRGFDVRLKRLLIADCFARWAEGIPDVFIVLYVINVLRYNALEFGSFISIQMLTSIALYIPIAKLSDRRNRTPYVLLTFVFFALYPLSLLSAGAYAATLLAFVIGGLREIGEPARKAMIVDFAEQGSRGRVIGLYYFIRGMAVFPASLAGAWLWSLNPRFPFYIAFLAGACAVFAFTAFSSFLSPRNIELQKEIS
jgi:MFS family permease